MPAVNIPSACVSLAVVVSTVLASGLIVVVSLLTALEVYATVSPPFPVQPIIDAGRDKHKVNASMFFVIFLIGFFPPFCCRAFTEIL